MIVFCNSSGTKNKLSLNLRALTSQKILEQDTETQVSLTFLCLPDNYINSVTYLTCRPQHPMAFIIDALWITFVCIPFSFARNIRSVWVVALHNNGHNNGFCHSLTNKDGNTSQVSFWLYAKVSYMYVYHGWGMVNSGFLNGMGWVHFPISGSLQITLVFLKQWDTRMAVTFRQGWQKSWLFF